MSWNVLRHRGADPRDVAALILTHRPDLLLLQEATEQFRDLPRLVGGHYEGREFAGGPDGLGAWSPNGFGPINYIELPRVIGRKSHRARLAMVIVSGRRTIANVHLSHGQILARRQIRHVTAAITGPAAIVGDFNIVGPVGQPRWKDAGPRATTHMAQGLVPFRLDRCLTREWEVRDGKALPRGPSDHRPILIDMAH